MKILVVSDAWYPQINGVVRTYEGLRPALEKAGHQLKVIGPEDCGFSFPCPQYPEIRLSVGGIFKLNTLINQGRAGVSEQEFHLHIATEGPLGWLARNYAARHGLIYSSCYHTEFPDYVAKRAPKFLYSFVKKIAQKFIKKFHAPAGTVFVATKTLEEKLKAQAFTPPLSHLTRGVDHTLFKLRSKTEFEHLKKPIALYVGRIAIEKNLEEFLRANWNGTKVIVGEGPDREKLQRTYLQAVFTGKKEGEELARCFSSADIFVFPSKTDTFGMVLTEAMAAGLPVAAFPVQGPIDIVTKPELGSLNTNLETAMRDALNAPADSEFRNHHALTHYSWDVAAAQFITAIRRTCFAPHSEL